MRFDIGQRIFNALIYHREHASNLIKLIFKYDHGAMSAANNRRLNIVKEKKKGKEEVSEACEHYLRKAKLLIVRRNEGRH